MAQIRTRKRGKTYSYIFEAGQVNGKRKVVEKGGFASKDEAYEAGVAAYTDWKHGNIGVTSNNISLSDFADLWMERVSADIKINTINNYTTIINNRIKPSIGSCMVQDITPSMIESWVSDMYQHKYSKGYIKQSRMVLKAMLDYAVYPGGLIKSNPCIYIKVPKNAPTGIVKRVIITGNRYHELMEKYPVGHNMRVSIAIFYHTGMRMGEVLGLTWDDIDFKEHSITINKQCIYSTIGPTHLRLTETKTEKSLRKIYVSDELIAELQAEKKRQSTALYKVVNGVDKDGFCYTCSPALMPDNTSPVHLVCITAKGRPVNRSLLAKCLREEGLNSHSFRHTQATRLAEAQVPPVTAARRLGHANVDTTLNLYTHDTDAMQKSVVIALKKH